MGRLVFLTGQPRVGKTTALKRIVSSLGAEGYSVGGVVTTELRERGVRVGFKLEDILSGRRGTLSHVKGEGPRLGKYHINLHDLAEVGAKALDAAIEQADVIGIDEIGPMELFSFKFKTSVASALDSGKPVVGTIHYRTQDPFVQHIRSRGDVKIIEVTLENRERIPLTVAGMLKKMQAEKFPQESGRHKNWKNT